MAVTLRHASIERKRHTIDQQHHRTINGRNIQKMQTQMDEIDHQRPGNPTPTPTTTIHKTRKKYLEFQEHNTKNKNTKQHNR